MPLSSVSWPAALLLLGLSSVPAGSVPTVQAPKWKPLFDYTNLPPSNEEFWEPLSKAAVPLERAIEVAKETEGTTVRTLKAALEPGPEGASWKLELFVGDEPEGPKRVNLSVSTEEPKVLRRLELRSIAPDEQAMWPALRDGQVPAEDSVEIAKKTAIGDKPTPAVIDPRVRTIRVFEERGVAIWDVELMALDKKQQKPRRYAIGVDMHAPHFKHMVLLDRFVGTPLRRNDPSELENGMVYFDFRPGEGEAIGPDTKVVVNYRLWLLDSTKIHDTWKTKLPETFVVSEAPLQGMREGLVGMKVGGVRKIVIPYEKAFGEKGNEISPPKATIVCDLHVDKIVTE
jgi:hypothetical protein